MMVKGGVKATSAGSGKTVILDRKQSSTLAGKYGDSVARAIQKAAEKGKAVNKTALVALLTTKGSKLDVDKARRVADKIIGNAKKPTAGQVGNPLKDKSSKMMPERLPNVTINQKVVEFGKGPATEGAMAKAADKKTTFLMQEDDGSGQMTERLVRVETIDKKSGDYSIVEAFSGKPLGEIGFPKERRNDKADYPDVDGAGTYRAFIPAGKLSDHKQQGNSIVLEGKGGKKLVDMASIYNLPFGNPTDKMTPAQIKERAAKIRANAEKMKKK